MIDWERVGDLRSEVGEADFAEVVELFLEEVQEVIWRLETTPEPARYEEDLHFLKGSALNLGFRAFSGLCQDGEQGAAKGETDRIDIAAVIACYAGSKQQFLAGIAAGRAVEAAA